MEDDCVAENRLAESRQCTICHRFQITINKSQIIIAKAKYSKKAEKKIGKVMHEFKEGKLKSGGSGKKVKSRKQTVAIAISEARESGAKVPKKTGVGRRKTGVKMAKKKPSSHHQSNKKAA